MDDINDLPIAPLPIFFIHSEKQLLELQNNFVGFLEHLLNILSIEVASMISCLVDPQDCQDLLQTILDRRITTIPSLPQFVQSFRPSFQNCFEHFQLFQAPISFFSLSNGFTSAVLALFAAFISFHSATR
jgi:hypothetical protein